MTALASGNKANGQKQFDDRDRRVSRRRSRAITTTTSPGTAWVARMRSKRRLGQGRRRVRDARSSSRPSSAMYQMWYGIALYEKAVADAREDQARKENKKPEEVKPDLVGGELREAAAAPAGGGRSSTTTCGARTTTSAGSIASTDKPKDAAEEFSTGDAGEPARVRARTSRSASSTASGTTPTRRSRSRRRARRTCPAPTRSSDIWYVLGMGYDDKRMDDKAIEAFTRRSRREQGQPQGEVPARPGVLPQGRLHAREARPRGVLEDAAARRSSSRSSRRARC